MLQSNKILPKCIYTKIITPYGMYRVLQGDKNKNNNNNKSVITVINKKAIA